MVVAGLVALVRYGWRKMRERRVRGDLEAGVPGGGGVSGEGLFLSAGDLARAEALVRAVGGGGGREKVALATIRTLRAGGLALGQVDVAPVASSASGSAGAGPGSIARRVVSGEGAVGE